MKQFDKDIILSAISCYDDFADFERCTNIDKDEFLDLLEYGELNDISWGYVDYEKGVYVAYELSQDNIIRALIFEYEDSNAEDWLSEDISNFDKLSFADKLLSMLQVDSYEYFTLNGHLYQLHE